MDNELLPFKNRTPYTVPEGFFEQSKAKILAAISETAEPTSPSAPKRVVEMTKRKSRKSFWMSIAAAAVVVMLVGGLAIPNFRSDTSELAMAKDSSAIETTPTTADDETSQKIGLYALADDDAEREAWTDFADDDIFLQSFE